MENHPFEWENPLWMAIFNSYFDITRGYIHKNGDEWRCFLGYTLNGHQTWPENPQNHRWFPQLETLNGGFHGGKNGCFLLMGSYQDVGNKWGYHQPMDWYSNKWGLYLKYSMVFQQLGIYPRARLEKLLGKLNSGWGYNGIYNDIYIYPQTNWDLRQLFFKGM